MSELIARSLLSYLILHNGFVYLSSFVCPHIGYAYQQIVYVYFLI